MPNLVYSARKILTMNPRQPQATHVAIRDGKILAVGTLPEVARWGEYTLDERHADKVLMPGLVEGHSHLMAGGMWRFVYAGYHARMDPDGKTWEGCTTLEAVVERLRAADAAMADPGEPLLVWGFDPIFFGTARMTVHDLDRVSTTRVVVILHASQHLMNVNSVALRRAGITRDTEVEGIARFADGEPTGELQEFAAMFPVTRLIGNAFRASSFSTDGLRMFGQAARLAGVTTATDLVNDYADGTLQAMVDATGAADYPVRLVPAFNATQSGGSLDEQLRLVLAARDRSTDKLRLGAVKIVADGSIQGFTARVRWPGYFNGSPNGIWIQPPAVLAKMVEVFHENGLHMHIHVNGDEATAVITDAIERAQEKHFRPDHRHVLQHCQMADAAQFRRMRKLGLCANLFANHIYYWGDAHYAMTMGPDRAERMDACRTALETGVPLAIHSDAPITPLGPLFTAWCAVNRRTSGGRILGDSERIGIAQALHAITLGAAYTLRMDHLVGSIEVGKFADFCILGDDPTQADPMSLKDIPVLGTILGGRPMQGQA